MVGASYVTGPTFSKDVPLPPILQVSSRAGLWFSVTTSNSAYGGTPQGAWQAQTRYPKPPPHWNTHYLNNLTKRLRETPSLRLVSAPVSEAQEGYRGLAGPKAPERYDALLTLYGQRDQLQRLEPLISTSHAHHRRFQRSEISPVNLPRSSSSRVQHLPRSSSSRVQHLPRSSSSSRVQHLPRPLVTLPFTGKNSEYMDAFTKLTAHLPPTRHQVSAQPSRDSTDVGVRVSDAEGGAGTGFEAVEHILEVPKMYVTENSNFGSKKMTLV